jgi:hypothetical protein
MIAQMLWTGIANLHDVINDPRTSDVSLCNSLMDGHDFQVKEFIQLFDGDGIMKYKTLSDGIAVMVRRGLLSASLCSGWIDSASMKQETSRDPIIARRNTREFSGIVDLSASTAVDRAVHSIDRFR